MDKYKILALMLFVFMIFPAMIRAQNYDPGKKNVTRDKEYKRFEVSMQENGDVKELMGVGPIAISRNGNVVEQSRSLQQVQEVFPILAYGLQDKNPVDESAKKQKNKCAVSSPIKMSAQELKQQLNQKDFLLVNVHIPYAGDIPQTDLSIPFDKIEQNLDKLPDDKNAKIVVYCRGGGMSAKASKELVKLGFTNVYDLEGGIRAWTKAGNKLDFNK
ncbi:MAG TPA: rhodanese-like domain-containing protein [Caldithrix abyssi]|uniref:Rhodanese-like domain-containing protein n=1 Tax=Caldithrix abyssi TaxID=187145 RepID=A0A7V4U2J7_CALAY|nr:rhodanese-like domain-containing protein [Caldithrix abyssi]